MVLACWLKGTFGKCECILSIAVQQRAELIDAHGSSCIMLLCCKEVLTFSTNQQQI